MVVMTVVTPLMRLIAKTEDQNVTTRKYCVKMNASVSVSPWNAIALRIALMLQMSLTATLVSMEMKNIWISYDIT